MNFEEALSVISEYLPITEGKAYDGIIVKKLEASNTLDEGRTTNQTHIAITGSQMDIFPYLRADGYFNCEYADKDEALKKYFIAQVPLRLYRSNVEMLSDEVGQTFAFNAENYCRVFASLVRSRRNGAADQMQMSLTTLDDSAFVSFRKLLHAGDVLVIMKRKGQLEYDCFGVKSSAAAEGSLLTLNNKFFKDGNNTKVKTDDVITIKDEEEIQSEYTVEELGNILSSMYLNAPKDMQTTAIHAFGIKYGKVISDNGYSYKDIAVAAGISENYQIEIGKGVRLYKSFAENSFGMTMWGLEGRYSTTPKGTRKTGGENVLLYGVPGSGKSHYIQEHYCSDSNVIERVVFHPDYTYSDFVGQILPRVEHGQLKYVFTPGPFTKILKEAWWNPEKEYFLIIEEINRGNAPAIFGEIFQLLDRKVEGEYPASEVGESEYGITNFDVAQEVYGYDHQEIRIPSNLSILATMNTADQNVFTLDTAFQRRWIMKMIENNVEAADHAGHVIEGSEVTWGAFASVVNEQVLVANEGISSSEDKRLGAYFALDRELKADRFPEKVLKYLWDDAFKLDRDYLFRDGISSLEVVIEQYGSSSEDKLKAVLRADVYQKMLAKLSKKPSESSDEDAKE
ncbi:McrB family protein [Faecalicatena contorta]|uniref:McrB family protein n=1 Tax=Faecalicatena contorta TaxID=39482 RepID=UPI001F18663A|nr:AAA family ATPase [Faecalicatena contorta]